MWSKSQGGDRFPFQPKTTKGNGKSSGNQSLSSNADKQPHLNLSPSPLSWLPPLFLLF